MKVLFGLLVAWTLIAFGDAFGAEAKFQSMEQYTRIQIPVITGSSFRFLSDAGEATIQLDRVKNDTNPPVAAWSDARVASVSYQASGLDKAELRVKFSIPGAESFAYMQGENLVLDIWAPKTPPKASPVVAQVKPKPKKVSRALASVKPKPQETVDPLQRDKDIFQKFLIPMPELQISASAGGFELPPRAKLEELWEFPKGDASTDEGKEYEFAKKLYAEKKYGLSLKAAEISLKKKTPYADLLTFLQAFCYAKLAETTETPSLADKAEAIFQELAAKQDKEGKPLPMNRSLRLYFAQREYLKGHWLEALGHLEYLAQSKERTSDLSTIQLLLADVYGRVNQPRRAERLYRNIVETKPRTILAKEAIYRVADLLALEKNYARVDEQVVEATKAYPEHEKARSEVLFQAGEANFWLKNYARAEKYFKRYTEISSAQTNSALAWVRLGEIAEIHHGNIGEARAAYLQAKNGYPFSRGDLVATVRLARIDLKTEKEPQYVINSLNAMLADKTIDSELKQMAEICLGQYYLLVGEIDKALTLAREGLTRTDGVVYESYKKNYMSALYAQLLQLTEEKKYAAALALYQREKKWFDVYGNDSLKALAKIYSGLGLYATSNETMEKYAKIQSAQSRSLASLEPVRQVSLTKGKNSFIEGSYAAALQELPKDSTDPDVIAMIAISAFKRGEKASAYKFADRLLGFLKKGSTSDLNLEDISLVFHSRAQEERDFAKGEREMDRLSQFLAADSELIQFTKAELIWMQKKHAQAIEAYNAFLEKFPKSERIARARYHLSMSLIGTGKREEAVKQLTLLRESGQGVWSESAKQELDLMEWERKYSTVLRTLPPSGLGISN